MARPGFFAGQKRSGIIKRSWIVAPSLLRLALRADVTPRFPIVGLLL